MWGQTPAQQGAHDVGPEILALVLAWPLFAMGLASGTSTPQFFTCQMGRAAGLVTELQEALLGGWHCHTYPCTAPSPGRATDPLHSATLLAVGSHKAVILLFPSAILTGPDPLQRRMSGKRKRSKGVRASLLDAPTPLPTLPVRPPDPRGGEGLPCRGWPPLRAP